MLSGVREGNMITIATHLGLGWFKFVSEWEFLKVKNESKQEWWTGHWGLRPASSFDLLSMDNDGCDGL